MADFKILIVDDDKKICTLLADELQDEGFVTFIAHNGVDAFKIVQSKQIDLVISDINMQNGNGIKLLNNINNMGTFSRPAVVMISGFSKLSKKELIERGASDYIKKPINFKSLLKTIDHYVQIKKSRQKKLAS